MRGSRVKALKRSFRETYGFFPAGTRRFVEPIPSKWWQRLLWKLSGKPHPTHQVEYVSIWRRWKKIAKESDRRDPLG